MTRRELLALWPPGSTATRVMVTLRGSFSASRARMVSVPVGIPLRNCPAVCMLRIRTHTLSACHFYRCATFPSRR